MIEDANKKLLGVGDIRAVIRKRIEDKSPEEKEEEKQFEEEWKKEQIDTREIRGTWKHSLDFLFSCISVSVGLGNVWRFPYLCYKNGGGVFLIIYFICMLFCGVPIFLQEVAIGQYLGAGGMTMIAKICPILKGVGIATMVMVTYYNIYYCIIVSWSLYYFIASFVSIPDVPWNTCDGYWNTENCWIPDTLENGSLSIAPHNQTVAAVEEFWNNRVLQANAGIEYGLELIQWELAGTLFLGWVIVYMIVWRGLHQSGYIIWFTPSSHTS
jgi:solute carrier family 6 GABA transporter-like protein 1